MKKKNFTLMELLTVLAIISILAALTMGGVQAVRRRATKAKAEAAIAALEVALGMYYNDLGKYPKNDETPDDCKELVETLTCKPENPEDPKDKEDWDGPYIRFKEKELEGCSASSDDCKKGCNYIDPWGNSYIYEKTTNFYLILSKGPDGERDDENKVVKDDISSK